MTTTEQAIAEAKAAMEAFRTLPGVREALSRLEQAQEAADATGAWETRPGQKVEATMGYLRMALEAAEG